jgi:chorismate dehydratase
MKLKVGWIQYANVYPIFYVLEKEDLLTEDIHLVTVSYTHLTLPTKA